MEGVVRALFYAAPVLAALGLVWLACLLKIGARADMATEKMMEDDL